jgi:hypothetical protein
MTPEFTGSSGNRSFDEATFIKKEKRSTQRQPTRAQFCMKVNIDSMEGVGSNISQTGAYFITCDEIPVELTIEGKHKSIDAVGQIVRVDRISEGSIGIAIKFDTRIFDVEI